MPRIILASTSRYRAALLRRLQLPFETSKPEVDETPRSNEAPLALAQRLAQAKCAAIAQHAVDAIVIGADQVADCGGVITNKPITRVAAIAQLQAASGRVLVFHSAVCVRLGAREIAFVDQTRCHFRTLTTAEIEAYVEREPAFDCAGSFKAEGLGITLVERIESPDPTGIIGLPLIALSQALREFGATCAAD